MARWEVMLPCQPPTLNQLMRGTLRARMALGVAFRAVVAAACNGSVPRAMGRRRVGITIVLGPRQRGADPDAYHKAVGDALESCGALRVDSRFGVEWAPVGYERGPERAARITLEDIP
jgi:hypothetical protein